MAEAMRRRRWSLGTGGPGKVDSRASERLIYPSEGASTTSSSQELHDNIVAILREEGKSLHLNEVYRRLAQRGLRVAGENPVRNVGGHLSLLKIEGTTIDSGKKDGMWGLVEWETHPTPSIDLALAGSILEELDSYGVTLHREPDGRLKAKGPFQNLPDEMTDTLKRNWDSISELLRLTESVGAEGQ